jgi:hypothetical protein
MTTARTAAEIQGDPKDDKRKQYEREVREVHKQVSSQYGVLHHLKQPTSFAQGQSQ